MDSDEDNCLVIDEDAMDAEDLLQPMNKIVEKEKDKSVEIAATNNVVIQPDITAAPADSPIRPPVRREEGSHKTKHQNAEKPKTKGDKSKSTPGSSDKRRNFYRHKAHSIRLSDAVFKENLLNVSRINCRKMKFNAFQMNAQIYQKKKKIIKKFNKIVDFCLQITAKKHQLYNMYFSYKSGVLSASIPEVYPKPPSFPELNLSQLLNWPDIKMSIALEHLTFVHEVKQNCERDLVFGNDTLVNVNTQINPTETRYFQKVLTSKVNSMVSKDMFNTYVSALMEAAPMYEIGPSKLPEIEHSFQKILNDVASIEFDSIQTRITHSRFLNKHRYFRVFDNDSKSTGGNHSKVRLRETINPEINFGIEKCCFTSDEMLIDVWADAMEEYFANVFVKRGSYQKDLLRDKFKRCLTTTCEGCNETFDGPLWAVKLKDHIRRSHFVDKPWTCVKCHRQWNQIELLQMEWNHECISP